MPALCHHGGVGTISERYDRSAARYERWWGPVLAPAAMSLLDAVEVRLGGRASGQVLDVGTGTGTLARAAAARWPAARVLGIDASAAMLGVARGETERVLEASTMVRLSWRTGLAQALPVEDGSVDLALSSFVMQLVPRRADALREMFRVLRPGGLLGYVTWLTGGDPYEPDEVFEGIVDDERLDDEVEPEEPRSGDLASATAAAAQLRRIGFREVAARPRVLEHRWTARSYLAFLERYDAADLFESLSAPRRRTLRDRTANALAGLPTDAFVWRAPVVTVLGRRPG